MFIFSEYYFSVFNVLVSINEQMFTYILYRNNYFYNLSVNSRKIGLPNFSAPYLLCILNLFIVVQVQLCPFSLNTPPQPFPPPILNPTPLWFCPCVLCRCSWKPFPFFPPLSHPTYPLVTVNLFLISMSLAIFCLLLCFVDYVTLIGEIIWYLSFT